MTFDGFPKTCDNCMEDEYSMKGMDCQCLPGSTRGAGASMLDAPPRGPCDSTPVDPGDTCVVNRRLPAFAIRMGQRTTAGSAFAPNELSDAPRMASGFGRAPPTSASRRDGGACHMGRLPVVGHTAVLDTDLSHSLQLCARAADHLACHALEQNRARANTSRSVLSFFDAPQNTAGARDRALDEQHGRRALCASCDKQGVQGVLPRFVNKPAQALNSTARSPLSVGEHVRLSPERVVAAKLRRELCGANATCTALERVAAAEDFRHGKLLRALLERGAPPAPEGEQARQQAREKAERALWTRPWVFCKHTKALFDGQDRREPGDCSGYIDRETWLDVRSRPGECAKAVGGQMHSDFKAPVHFCLLHDDTGKLCSAMTQWRASIRRILCQASGACPSESYFYTPTTFDLSSQEFVFDSVRRFYIRDCKRDCTAAEKKVGTHRSATGTEQQLAEQIASNAAALGECASSAIQPLYDAVAGARVIKRKIAVMYYYYYRVVQRFVQLLVVLVVDTATDVVGAASGGKFDADIDSALAEAAQKLATSCAALVESIGSLFEAAQQAMLKLFMSRGIGGSIRTIITFVCRAVKWIINSVWVPGLCPALDFVFNMLEIGVGVYKAIDDGLSFIGIDIPGFTEIIDLALKFIKMLSRFTDNCKDQRQDHPCEPGDADNSTLPEDVALAVPTRCWSTYLTFFGDHQQLSCTAADTCRKSRMQSARTMCGGCPTPLSETLAFGCDEVTKLCTCGIKIHSETLCSANEDCELEDSSCQLLDADLLLSTGDIPCSSCSSARVCFHGSSAETGRCACSAGFQDRLQRCSRDQGRGAWVNPGYFLLDSNSLCLWHSAGVGVDIDVVEFKSASVIPCMHLDPSEATCAHAIDINLDIVRGGRRVSGRRLLGVEAHAEGGGVWSHDPLCRDALQSPLLAQTRSACSEALRRSNHTIAVLGLSRELPPCTLCSLTDVARAAAQNPLGVLNLLVHAPAVLARHGPFADAAAVFSAILDGVQKSASVLEADPRPLIFLGSDGAPRVGAHIADEGILPAEVVLVIERALRFVSSAANRSGAALGRGAPSATPASRHLLFFREIIDKVAEDRSPTAAHPDPLIAAGLAEVFGHRYPGADATETLVRARASAGSASATGSASAPGLWSSAKSAEAAYSKQKWPLFVRGELFVSCAELVELWRIAVRCANGTFSGWKTLTTERARLEGVPAARLRDAWPPLMRANTSSFGPPSEALSFTPPGLDAATLFAARAVAWIFESLGIAPHVAYDLYYSVASVLEDSFVCDYESVQVCSRRRVTLEHGVVIIGVYVLAVYVVLTLFGLGMLVALFAPLFGLGLFYLCYGYAWTCLPMLPVCLLSDVESALAVVLPLSLAVPSALKKNTDDCRGVSSASQEECYELLKNGFTTVFDSSVKDYARCYFEQDYPQERCLVSCRESPFSYTSAADVFAWLLVELGDVFVDAARDAAAYVGPLVDTEAFVQTLNLREAALGRQVGSADVSAHRICALLNIHMLVPYVCIALLVLAYASALVFAVAGSLFPFFMLLSKVFATVSTGDERETNAENEDSDAESES
jgi:hypothetical protein